MKMHAYFREKILNAILKDSQIALFIPEWAKKQGMKVEDLDQPQITVESLHIELYRFFYFFMAPTLIYRDTYVMIKRFRWQVLVQNFITCLVLIVYVWCIFKAMCIPVFQHTSENPGSLRQFV